ncbi:MAG: hypothetical protein MZV65_46250 [Chromatiales bacterium]|nr:hypothetical protein [Chromatiales bacterium]
MAYTFTEKKRIRKRLRQARRASSRCPTCSRSSSDSYREFLQADVPPRSAQDTRAAGGVPVGLPDHQRLRQRARSSYVELSTSASPVFDVDECQQRGLTFAAPLRVDGAAGDLTDKEAEAARRSRTSRSRRSTWARSRS